MIWERFLWKQNQELLQMPAIVKRFVAYSSTVWDADTGFLKMRTTLLTNQLTALCTKLPEALLIVAIQFTDQNLLTMMSVDLN